MAPIQNPFSFNLIPNAPLCLFDDRGALDDLKPGVRFEFSEASGKSFNFDLPPTNGNSTCNTSSRLACSGLRGEIENPSKSTDANTQFTYDALGRCVKIVETVASSVTSTKQYVWCGAQRCEERDGSGSLSNGKQFFPLGQVNFASGTPTNYFYTQDHLGSTREMTKTVSGTTTIEAQYAYDPYGIATKLQGSQDSDFQYAGYYMHARSGLNLTRTRQYSSPLGRWISRDPIGENGGVNLFGYVENNPIIFTDPSGMDAPPAPAPVQAPPGAVAPSMPTALLILTGALMVLTLGGDNPVRKDNMPKELQHLTREQWNQILEWEAARPYNTAPAPAGGGGGERDRCRKVRNQGIQECGFLMKGGCNGPFFRCLGQYMADHGCGIAVQGGRWSPDFQRWIPNR